MPKRFKALKKKSRANGKRYPLNLRTTYRMRQFLEREARRSGRSIAAEIEIRLEKSTLKAEYDTKLSEHAQIMGALKRQIEAVQNLISHTIFEILRDGTTDEKTHVGKVLRKYLLEPVDRAVMDLP